MSYNNTGQSVQDQGELHGTDALSDWLGCGLIVIHGEKQNATLAGGVERILGLGSADTLASLADLPASLRTLAQEARASGRAIRDRHIDLTVPGRGLITLSVSAIPTQPGVEDSGLALMFKDLTSIKRLEQDMNRLDRLASLGTLSASMAHEIKNALVAGKTFVDLLLERNPEAEMGGVVQRELARIDSIVSQVLQFSGMAKPVFATIHLHEILEHSLRLVGPQVKAKSISLSRVFGATPDVVRGNGHQLQQAFVNLLLNSLEALGPQGKLTVATEALTLESASDGSRNGAPGSQLRIIIADNGPGIPSENMGRLFEPFFTTKPAGTGLGLAVTRRIVQEHRGSITLESEPNKGATFCITLPALDEVED